MQQKRRMMSVFASVLMGVVALTAAPSGATHPHHIDTPGTCVDRNGAGFGTGEAHVDNSGDPGDTTFHERVHKGEPGTFAFAQQNNPVSVAGGRCP